jgi:hypothetical protein
MADPIQTRNVIAQTSLVEKIKQVQQQQGDLHQRNIANPKKDELERKTREVQTSQESAEARIRDKRKEGKGRGKEKGASSKTLLMEDGEKDLELEDESGPGRIIDIKV